MASKFLRFTLKAALCGGAVTATMAVIPPDQITVTDVPEFQPVSDTAPVSTADYTRTTTYFKSRGAKCEAWVFTPQKPATSEQVPVVVMGHGLAAQKDFNLEKFVAAFTKAGMAVFLFDYPGFGGSEGKPRNLVDGPRHVQDFQAAIEHVRKEHKFGRMALWGTSFSGGHVLATAAKTSGVACVVSQVPFLDMQRCILDVVRNYGVGQLCRLSCAAAKDILGDLLLGKPYYVKIYGQPGEWGMLCTPECQEGYGGFVSKSPRGGWENAVLARLGLTIMLYRPYATLPQVPCPVLLVAGEQDSLCPFSMIPRAMQALQARPAFSKNPAEGAELCQLSCNHFDVYNSPWFETVIDTETKFLQKHLIRGSH